MNLASPTYFSSLSDELLSKIAAFSISHTRSGQGCSTNIQSDLCQLASEGSPFQAVAHQLVHTLVIQDINDLTFLDTNPTEPGQIDFFSKNTNDQLRERILKCLGSSFKSIHCQVNHLKDSTFPHGIARYCTSVTKLELGWTTNHDAIHAVIDNLLPTLSNSLEDLSITCRHFAFRAGRRSVMSSVLRHLQYGPCIVKVLYVDYLFIANLTSLWPELGRTLRELSLRSSTKTGWTETIEEVKKHVRKLVAVSFIGSDLPNKQFVDMLVTYGAQLERVVFHVPERSECVRLITCCLNVSVTALSYISDMQHLVGLSDRLNRLTLGLGLSDTEVDEESMSKINDNLNRLELAGHCTQVSLKSIFSHSFLDLHDLHICDSSLVLTCESIRNIARATGNLRRFHIVISTVVNPSRFESLARANPHMKELEVYVALKTSRCPSFTTCLQVATLT